MSLTEQQNIMLHVQKDKNGQILVISGCIFKPQTKNIAVGTFPSNFLDINKSTVDSRKNKNNTENNQKKLCFFPSFTFYIWLNIDSLCCHVISSFCSCI